MNRALRAAALASAALLVAASPRSDAQAPALSAVTLAGRVSLLMPPKVKVDPGGVVVWIPGVTIPGRPVTADSVTSRDKRFDPRIIVVPAGTRVRFPNVDPIYHNAFSLTPGNAFDMGLYRKGASRDTVLRNPGIVRVYCNIHPDMAASVVVVDGNAYTIAQADGSFRIDGIPPGRHEVHVWSDLAGETVTVLDFDRGVVAWNPALDASRYQRTSHLNKHGKPYPKAKNDADRY